MGENTALKSQTALADTRVLVVDDLSDAREPLLDTLNGLGLEANAVDSGQRAIDRQGVMPQPAENRARLAGTSAACRAKSPAGASAGSSVPGWTLSSSQLETSPPATRRTVIDSVSGRVGLDEIE